MAVAVAVVSVVAAETLIANIPNSVENSQCVIREWNKQRKVMSRRSILAHLSEILATPICCLPIDENLCNVYSIEHNPSEGANSEASNVSFLLMHL